MSTYYLYQAIKHPTPKKFKIADKTYVNILDSENFICEEDVNKQTFTPREIISRHTGTYYRSKAETVTLPKEAYLISASGRQKILRAYQYNKNKSTYPIFPKEILAFLEDMPPGDGASSAKREYQACCWATGNNHEAAAALLITSGFTPDPITRNKSERCSIFTLQQIEDGVNLTITDDTDIERRYSEACKAALEEAKYWRTKASTVNKLGEPQAKLDKEIIEKIEGAAYSKFFYYSEHGIDHWLSLTKEYSEIYRRAIKNYVDTITNGIIPNDEIQYLDEPEVPPIEDWEAPETYFIPFSAFISQKKNAASNKTIGYNANYENVRKKAAEYGLTGDQLYQATYLRTILNPNTYTSAKNNGFIIKEKGGFRLTCLAD